MNTTSEVEHQANALTFYTATWNFNQNTLVFWSFHFLVISLPWSGLPELRNSDNALDKRKPLPTSLQSDFIPEDVLFALTQPPAVRDQLGPPTRNRNLNVTTVSHWELHGLLQLCSTKCSLVHISLDIFWTAMRFFVVLFFSGTLKASSFQPVESQKERKVQAPHRKHTLYLWSWEVEILFCSSYCNLLFNLHVCHTSLNIIHNEFFQWHFFPLWCSSPWEKAGKTRQIGQKFCSKGSFG